MHAVRTPRDELQQFWRQLGETRPPHLKSSDQSFIHTTTVASTSAGRRPHTPTLSLPSNTQVEVLCRGYPPEFATYLNYCRSLKFADKPDYSYLRKMFKDLFFREGYAYDHNFDWTLKNNSTANTSAAAPVKPPGQL